MSEERNKQTIFRLTEAEHQSLRLLAVRERKSIQELILLALEKAFPHWQENK